MLTKVEADDYQVNPKDCLVDVHDYPVDPSDRPVTVGVFQEDGYRCTG